MRSKLLEAEWYVRYQLSMEKNRYVVLPEESKVCLLQHTPSSTYSHSQSESDIRLSSETFIFTLVRYL